LFKTRDQIERFEIGCIARSSDYNFIILIIITRQKIETWFAGALFINSAYLNVLLHEPRIFNNSFEAKLPE